MRLQQHLVWLSMMAMALASAGCCCVQGTGPCGSSCDTCPPGPMARMANCGSCAGGCGETYVDEWVSQPPCVDACCSGDCRPIRSLLQALWGCRFNACCDTGCSSGACDEGCDSCGYASAGGSGCTSCGGSVGMPASGGGCNCGGGVPMEAPVHEHASMAPHGSSMVTGQMASQPRRVKANVASQRINPASQKMDARRASYAH